MTMPNHLCRRSLRAVAAAALAFTALQARAELQTTASATIQDLRGVDELKSMFNRDAGKVRLVLLLSPT